MKQQVQSKRQLVSFPPINDLIKRYNSVSMKSISSNSSELQSPSLLKSQKSSLSSLSSDIKKLYITKSISYFKKSTFNRDKHLEKDKKEVQTLPTSKQLLRLIDSQNVIATYKAMAQPKNNCRLMQKTQNLMRISNYDDFSPFKRSHQISKKVPKVEEDIQAYKNISENSRVK